MSRHYEVSYIDGISFNSDNDVVRMEINDSDHLGVLDDKTLDFAQPHVHVRKNTRQTISSGADNIISFGASDVEESDLLGFHSPTVNPTRFIVPSGWDGVYLIIGTVSWEDNSTGRRSLYFRKNGATTGVWSHFGKQDIQASNNSSITSSAVIPLAASDYVEMVVYQNSGVNRVTYSIADAGATPTEFRMDRLFATPAQ